MKAKQKERTMNRHIRKRKTVGAWTSDNTEKRRVRQAYRTGKAYRTDRGYPGAEAAQATAAVSRQQRSRSMRILLLTVLLLGLAVSLRAVSIEDGEDILRSIDKMSNFEQTNFSSLLTMISQDPEKGVERTTVQQFRKDDEEKFLLLIQEPAVKKGQGYLRIDDNLWFYDPESRKFSHTSMKDQFNDSDANNSDFNASSLEEDYKVTAIEEGTLGQFSVYIMDIEAVNDEVTYPTQKLWVTRENSLLLKSEDYSAGGRLLRTSYFPSYAKAGDNYTPTKMLFIDELVEGKKTQITISDISTKKLPESIFTKSYVERVNN